jgi:AcrR family transcriptional regulator
MPPDLTLRPRKQPTQQRSIAMVNAILEACARILEERGYSGMSTNNVAERAGVSIGSLYQYFPGKEALLVALRDRHAAQMGEAIGAVLSDSAQAGLRPAIAALVRAAIAAHEVEPELHRVLEKELSFFEEDSERVGKDIHRHIMRLLKRHQNEISHPNLDLAAWMTMRMTEALVHAAVLDSPAKFTPQEVEAAVIDAICAFLAGPPQ